MPNDDRVLRDEYRTETPLLWFAGIAASLIGIGSFFLVVRSSRHDTMLFVVVSLFPLAGLFFLSLAIYSTVRRSKFGMTTCRLEQVPIRPGEILRGEIETRMADPPADGFLFDLECDHVVTMPGRNSARVEVLWEQEERVPGSAASVNAERLRLPSSSTFPGTFPPPISRAPTTTSSGA